MAEILDRDDVAAVPQQDDARCIYASDGQALVSVSVRTREQFDAERDRFESSGVKLPELIPVEGFVNEASTDPRYNSLNVTACGRIISVEIVGTEPSDPDRKGRAAEPLGVLGLPPEQPSHDGAEELARKAAVAIDRGR